MNEGNPAAIASFNGYPFGPAYIEMFTAIIVLMSLCSTLPHGNVPMYSASMHIRVNTHVLGYSDVVLPIISHALCDLKKHDHPVYSYTTTFRTEKYLFCSTVWKAFHRYLLPDRNILSRSYLEGHVAAEPPLNQTVSTRGVLNGTCAHSPRITGGSTLPLDFAFWWSSTRADRLAFPRFGIVVKSKGNSIPLLIL